MQTFSKESLENNLETSFMGWKNYIKVVPTRMVRIEGPFTVETLEGPLSCPDGFLAIDSGGNPYPIAVEEHERIYREQE